MSKEYGITPEQYHAACKKLWDALDNKEDGVNDVFTLCANKIEQLQEVINMCDETLSDDFNLENEDLPLYSEQAVNRVHRELSGHACWQSKE